MTKWLLANSFEDPDTKANMKKLVQSQSVPLEIWFFDTLFFAASSAGDWPEYCLVSDGDWGICRDLVERSLPRVRAVLQCRTSHTDGYPTL